MSRKIEKRAFPNYDSQKEEDYLVDMAKNGWRFANYDDMGYHFESDQAQDRQYIVEYFLETLPNDGIEFYKQQGFQLDAYYQSAKGGAWYYFSRPFSEVVIERNQSDRKSMIEAIIRRVELFGFGICIALLFLAMYLYSREHNPVYLLVIIGDSALGIFLLSVYQKMKKQLKIINK